MEHDFIPLKLQQLAKYRYIVKVLIIDRKLSSCYFLLINV